MTYSLFKRAKSTVARVRKSLTLFVGLTIFTFANAADPIRVASKIDTEGGLLGNIIV